MTCFSHKRRKRDITKWRAFPLLARHTVLVGQRANAATVKQQSWIVKAAEFQFMTHIHKNLHAQKYWSWLAVEAVRQRDIFTKSQRAFRWVHVLRDPLWTRGCDQISDDRGRQAIGRDPENPDGNLSLSNFYTKRKVKVSIRSCIILY